MRVIAIIAIAYAVITEFLDWHGRAEIIERRFPKTWAVIGSRSARVVLILFALGLLLLPREVAAPETQPHVAPAASPAPESPAGGGSAQSSPVPDKAEPKQPSQEPLMMPLPNAKPRKAGGPVLVQQAPSTPQEQMNEGRTETAQTERGDIEHIRKAATDDGQQSTQLASKGENSSSDLQATSTTASTGQAGSEAERTQINGTVSDRSSQSATSTAEVADAKVGDLKQSSADVSGDVSGHTGYGKPKRVVVLDFDYPTVAAGSAAIFGSNVDIGKGMADLVARNLAQSGKYIVIDRKEVNKILAEQNFSNSDRANPAAVAKLGKLLAADAVITGSITQFGHEVRDSNIGGGGGQWSGVGALGHRKSKAVVAIDTRVIDLSTAEIEAVADAKGQSSRESTSMLGAGDSSHGSNGGTVNFESRDFQNSILGEAVNDAVRQTSAQLVADESKVASHQQVVEGLIAAVDGSVIVLNVGRKNGLAVGDELNVVRTTSKIVDPATGSVTRRTDTPVGVVKLTDVDDNSAVASAVSGSGFKVGDSIKLVTSQPAPDSATPQR